MLFATCQIIFIVLGLFMCKTTGHTNDDEMCIPFRRSQWSAPPQPAVRQGRPGKIGPQGLPGPKGNRGEPGRCGCDPSEIQQLNNTIQMLQEMLHQATQKITFVENRVISPNYLVKICSVGLKDGRVRDKDITASSIWGNGHNASNGRLDYLSSRSPYKSGAWAAKTNTVGEWIQVDLRKSTRVTGVVTQGRGDHDQWVTSFKVSYGNSYLMMQTMKSSNGSDRIFSGNSNRNSYVINRFPNSIIARYFRIVVQTWHSHVSLRVDLITC